MKVGVFGAGVVGGALISWLRNHTKHELKVKDPNRGLDDDFKDIKCVFICVPVPTNPDRTQNLGIVESILQYLAVHHPKIPIFVKSTLQPGTSDFLSAQYRLDVNAMPEFLTQRTAYDDFESQPVLFGGNPGHKILIHELFPNKKVIMMSKCEAEIAKCAHNAFGAVKVNFFNIIYQLSKYLDADYSKVLKGILMSGYINETHTKVPGPDGSYGYGGACFPKDLAAFIGVLFDFHLHGSLSLTAVENDNYHFRKIPVHFPRKEKCIK